MIERADDIKRCMKYGNRFKIRGRNIPQPFDAAGLSYLNGTWQLNAAWAKIGWANILPPP